MRTFHIYCPIGVKFSVKSSARNAVQHFWAS